MTDPFERAVATAPPIIGSGCTQRYDPEALLPDQGAEFAGAAALWTRLQNAQSAPEPAGNASADDGSGPGRETDR